MQQGARSEARLVAGSNREAEGIDVPERGGRLVVVCPWSEGAGQPRWIGSTGSGRNPTCPEGDSLHAPRTRASATRDESPYSSVIARPLRSRFASNPTCRPVSSSTAPFWLVSTIARAPVPTASPAPAAP